MIIAGIHSARFSETGIWNCLLKEELKDLMKLDLSSKRMNLDETEYGKHQRITLPMLTLSSFLHNSTSSKPKENHHPLVFVVDFDFINSMIVQTLGKMDISF